MNILFCASEAAPWADHRRSWRRGRQPAQGAGAKRCGLPCGHAALRRSEGYRDKTDLLTNFTVPVGWRSQYCGLFRQEADGVTYYLLDNEYYFKRNGLLRLL